MSLGHRLRKFQGTGGPKANFFFKLEEDPIKGFITGVCVWKQIAIDCIWVQAWVLCYVNWHWLVFERATVGRGNWI